MKRVILLKPTESCNANCAYCYVKDQYDNQDLTKNMGLLSLEIVETLFNKINSFLMVHTDDTVHIIWHGGEITMAGAEYLEKSVQIFLRSCKETRDRISHSVQSNLTMINQNMVDTFKKLGIHSIGTSYDLIPNIRGMGKAINSKIYNKRFFEGVNLLKRNNLQAGIIYVVTKKTQEKDHLDVFHHLSNIGSFKYNNLRFFNKEEDIYNLEMSEEEFGHFLGKSFEHWWKYKYTLPLFGPFRYLHSNVLNNKNDGVCSETGGCAYSYMYVKQNGKVGHCGCEPSDVVYGDIKTDTLDEIFAHPIRDKMLARHHILVKGFCSDCRFWGVCHGSCAYSAYNINNDFYTPIGCESKKIFLEQYYEPITKQKINMKPHSIEEL